MSEPRDRKYLRRFYATLLVAGLLSYFPHPMFIVRFICIMLFGILAAWTEQAAMENEAAARGSEKGGV